MTNEEKKEFSKSMYVCYRLIGVEPDPATIDAYFGMLSKYELQDVQQAINKVLMKLKTRTLPMVGEIVENIYGKDDDKIAFAFEDAKTMIRKLGMYGSVKMSNPISQQIIKDLGGLLRWDELTYAYDHGKNDKLFFEWQRMYKNYLDKIKRGEWMPDERPISGYGSSYDSSGKYKLPQFWGYTDDKIKLEQKKYPKLEYKN